MQRLESRERQPACELAQRPSAYISWDLPFPAHGDVDPNNSILVSLLFYLCRVGNCTHDPIAKLLIDDRLICISIILNDLVQSIYQRLLGWHLNAFAPVWKTTHL